MWRYNKRKMKREKRKKLRFVSVIQTLVTWLRPLTGSCFFISSLFFLILLGSGDRYGAIQKVISIVITEEKIIKQIPRYHHRFTFYDPQACAEFSDIIEIHTIELGKLPENADGTELYDWASFIYAESEEELNMVAARNPKVKKAVVTLQKLSADEQARDMYERREKAMRDIDSRERWARAEGKAEGKAEIIDLLKSGKLPEDIIREYNSMSNDTN